MRVGVGGSTLAGVEKHFCTWLYEIKIKIDQNTNSNLFELQAKMK
jgi:hypothetical protein